MVVVGFGELIFYECGFVVVVSVGSFFLIYFLGGVYDVCGGVWLSIDVFEY